MGRGILALSGKVCVVRIAIANAHERVVRVAFASGGRISHTRFVLERTLRAPAYVLFSCALSARCSRHGCGLVPATLVRNDADLGSRVDARGGLAAGNVEVSLAQRAL